MSVNKSVKQPEIPPTGMAANYERAWNEVVSECDSWKKNIIINNFEVISGHHVYHSKADQRLMSDVMEEVIRRAERNDN
jgi:hypothetical protein